MAPIGQIPLDRRIGWAVGPEGPERSPGRKCHPTGFAEATEVPEQAGAIPWRLTAAGPEVLLITSSMGERWIVPRGWMQPGLSGRETALNEAYEEAGVEGIISPEPIGLFRFKRGDRTLLIVLFHLEVTKIHDEWEEDHLRRREWLSPHRAAEAVRDAGLRELIRELGAVASSGRIASVLDSCPELA